MEVSLVANVIRLLSPVKWSSFLNTTYFYFLSFILYHPLRHIKSSCWREVVIGRGWSVLHKLDLSSNVSGCFRFNLLLAWNILETIHLRIMMNKLQVIVWCLLLQHALRWWLKIPWLRATLTYFPKCLAPYQHTIWRTKNVPTRKQSYINCKLYGSASYFHCAYCCTEV